MKLPAIAIAAIDRLRDFIKREHTDERSFDRRHGIETGGYLPIAGHEADPDLAARVHDYHGTPVRILRDLMRRLPPMDRARTVFIDYGAGLGRCLFVAIEEGFGKAVGIELCEDFHRRGLANIGNCRLPAADRQRICLHRIDAREFLPPQAETVFFLFNPFDAGMTAEVAAHIAAGSSNDSHPRFIIYYNPWYREAFDRHPAYRIIDEGTFKRRWRLHRYYPYVIYRLGP